MDEVNVETAHISVLYSALHTDILNHFNTRVFASGYRLLCSLIPAINHTWYKPGTRVTLTQYINELTIRIRLCHRPGLQVFKRNAIYAPRRILVKPADLRPHAPARKRVHTWNRGRVAGNRIKSHRPGGSSVLDFSRGSRSYSLFTCFYIMKRKMGQLEYHQCTESIFGRSTNQETMGRTWRNASSLITWCLKWTVGFLITRYRENSTI